MKKYLVIIRRSPYDSSMSNEILELAFALGAFNQTVSLLFIDSGILQLLNKQQGDLIGYKNYTKAYNGLSLFEINNVYTTKSSMHGVDIANLMIQPQIIDDSEVSRIINENDIILDL